MILYSGARVLILKMLEQWPNCVACAQLLWYIKCNWFSISVTSWISDFSIWFFKCISARGKCNSSETSMISVHRVYWSRIWLLINFGLVSKLLIISFSFFYHPHWLSDIVLIIEPRALIRSFLGRLLGFISQISAKIFYIFVIIFT